MRLGFSLITALVALTVSCGDPNPCGGGLFESCELNDTQAAQNALDRPESKLAYPQSQLLDQAAKGLKGEYTPSGTEGRVTRLFLLPSDTTFGQVIHYYDDKLTALGWQRAAEPPDVPMHRSVTPDNFVRWIFPRGEDGDLFILTSAELPQGEYRAQLTIDGIDSTGRDSGSAYLQTKLDSPDPIGWEPPIKASTSR